MIKQLKKLFKAPKTEEEPPKNTVISLVIPNSHALGIQLDCQLGAERIAQLQQSYKQHCLAVPLMPFMCKQAYCQWLEKVLALGAFNLDFTLVKVSLLNLKLQQWHEPDLISNLVTTIKQHESSDVFRLDSELSVLLGDLRRAVKKIRCENLTDIDKQQLKRLSIALTLELNKSVVQRWLSQVKLMCKKSWS